jgi:hypothetical protein
VGEAGAVVEQTQEDLGSCRAAELGKAAARMRAKLSSRLRGHRRSSAEYARTRSRLGQRLRGGAHFRPNSMCRPAVSAAYPGIAPFFFQRPPEQSTRR